jgi:hypothetical protein
LKAPQPYLGHVATSIFDDECPGAEPGPIGIEFVQRNDEDALIYQDE